LLLREQGVIRTRRASKGIDGTFRNERKNGESADGEMRGDAGGLFPSLALRVSMRGMGDARWEFWIDVGGTFTDCIAKTPDGSLRRHKLLSSGVTKGRAATSSSRDVIIDPLRRQDPADFWVGWSLTLLDDAGVIIEKAKVTAFDPASGQFRLRGLQNEPREDAAYELACDLEAPVIAVRYLLQRSLAEGIPPVTLRLGTTRGTNALLTRTGARTALVTTRGFGDVLEIGYQARPRIFELTVKKEAPLASITIEIDERVTHEGAVLVSPDEATVRLQLVELAQAGIESVAIALLHADRHPEHEIFVERIAREIGFEHVSRSSAVAPLPRLVARADTTVVDAYLTPVLRDYVSRLQTQLPVSHIRLLTSAGGLVPGERFFGKDSILSGPAGGVVGFSSVARACGFENAIGFDMGGTSTDVSRFDGRFELEYETEKAGVRLVAPTLAIETVAAGGGSICRFDGVKLVVGPESAGADPGPACYGRGGPLTITDVNLFLGRIVPERFPFPLDRYAAKTRLWELVREVEGAPHYQQSDVARGRFSPAETDTPPLTPPHQGEGDNPPQARKELTKLAEGLLQIANANMAAAIRTVTIAKGMDPRDYVLVAFGGAAPQHACAVARELGIRRVLVHPDAGLLSALGIGRADVTRHRSCGIERALDAESFAFAQSRLDELERAAVAEIIADAIPSERIKAIRSFDLRYRGIDACLTIELPADGDLEKSFTTEHRRRYGYVHPDRPLEILAARVEVTGSAGDSVTLSRAAQKTKEIRPNGPIDRSTMSSGDHIIWPSIITDDTATTVVDGSWQAEMLSGGELLLTDHADSKTHSAIRNSQRVYRPGQAIENAPDPVFLEIFNNLLASTAEQMGVTLRNTASSVNVKERLDFSCAIFAADGRLAANAAHLPVHLGAMEATVKRIIAANPAMRPGDVFATNDPYEGGSHLPDITVVTPVFSSVRSFDTPPLIPPHQGEGDQTSDMERGRGESDVLLFLTANRAHHAEIGGMSPGSMPPFSRTLADEGVLIRNFKLVDAGESRFSELRDLLLSGKYPTRDVETNLADLAAQVAANRQGANDLLAIVDRYSWPVVRDYMEHVQTAAERKLRNALERFALSKTKFEFVDYLELRDGRSTPIAVRIVLHGAEETPAATIDFTGTGPVIDGNLNANPAIVTAAVIYVLRLLINEDIPINHGMLRPIEIVLPECLLNPSAGATPEESPAIAAGNVETSQRVVDVLLGAFGLAGASQGTMNNLLFGDDSFGYYETICGGSGATADGPGASAVQVHMTNTRLTDPEVLERRYPVRLHEFAVRRGTGGAGKYRGGDGTVRRIEFLRPVELSLISQRRGPHPPYGMNGGEPGALGKNTLIRADGRREPLSGIVHLSVSAGDSVLIETPGGGGFGQME
jgi:5-oxoprolinase (ATP-hydrolysing)